MPEQFEIWIVRCTHMVLLKLSKFFQKSRYCTPSPRFIFTIHFVGFRNSNYFQCSSYSKARPKLWVADMRCKHFSRSYTSSKSLHGCCFARLPMLTALQTFAGSAEINLLVLKLGVVLQGNVGTAVTPQAQVAGSECSLTAKIRH